MKSLWNEEEASLYTDPVAMRAYTSRLLGQSEDLVLHGGGGLITGLPLTENQKSRLQQIRVAEKNRAAARKSAVVRP